MSVCVFVYMYECVHLLVLAMTICMSLCVSICVGMCMSSGVSGILYLQVSISLCVCAYGSFS